MTHVRKLMLDELQRRNYAQNTVRAYIHAVEDFARYFHRSPDRLGPEHIREYQVHLFRDCKLSPGTIEGRTCSGFNGSTSTLRAESWKFGRLCGKGNSCHPRHRPVFG